MNLKEKLPVANQLTVFGVDVAETGFSISSQEDFEGVKTLYQQIKTSSIVRAVFGNIRDRKHPA
jgi:isopropylmalate/homocitrate/citramalate synthase